MQWMDSFHTVLGIVFDLPVVIPHVPDANEWLETTLDTYICLFNGDDPKNMLPGFFSDPLRAGQYVLDGQKIASVTTTFLEILRYPSGGKNLKE